MASGLTPDPSRLPPVDVDEFATAYNLVMNSAAGRVALEHRLGEPPEENKTTPHRKYWAIADKPLNRGLAALRERYTDPYKFNNLALRIAAVSFAAARPELQPWLRPNPDDPRTRLVHPAVIDAAAASPLTADYEFNLPEFLGRIEQLAQEKYSDGE